MPGKLKGEMVESAGSQVKIINQVISGLGRLRADRGHASNVNVNVN